jgi:phage gp46-like protein
VADLYLMPTDDGGQIEIVNGKPTMTDGLMVAVYLSLFTPAWWGNAASVPAEQYTGNLSEVLDGPLTLQTRLDVIAAAKMALQWMLNEGIASRVTIDAEIRTSTRLDLLVVITEPGGQSASQRYAMNWAAQEVEIA